MGVSALAGTISSPFVTKTGGIGIPRWLRSAFSLALAVGILAVALPVAFGSGASGAAVNPAQVFSSSSLIAPDAGGTAQLSVAGLVPGQSRSAIVRVANPGSAAAFGLSSRVSGSPLLAAELLLKIEAPSGKTLFDGRLAGLSRLALGSFAAGAQRAYRFTVSLPGGAGNEVAGATMSASFAWFAS
jgi:hypothetical protein